MAIKSSGSLAMTEIVAEFGGSVPHSLSEYYRDGGAVPGNNTNVPTSGNISMGNFFDAVNEIQYTVSSSTTNFQTSSAFGSNWSTAVPKRLTVDSGVVIGSSNGNPAWVIEGSMGGTLTVHNTGSIQGTGGSGSNSGSGSAGGPAIRSDQNGNITFYNNSGGQIYAGGGGGGKGGTGGTGGTGGAGGTGGNGSYQSQIHYFAPFTIHSSTYNVCSPGGNSYVRVQPQQTGTQWCQYCYGGHAFATSYQWLTHYRKGRVQGDYGSNVTCAENATSSGGAGGSGGSGGSGGAGGAGGNGRGYNQTLANGSAGSSGSGGNSGSGGASGSNSAGNGGTGGAGATGGTGGTGGNGGDWGTDGATGNTGATGGTGSAGSSGSNGNASNGAGGASGNAGAGGASGSAGGSTSFYIQNRNYMTFHNSGSVAGN